MKKNDKSLGLLQLIDRKMFAALVAKWEADKWVRDFKTWEFTCALVTVMSAKIGSYREVEYTLGIARSTFGDAMAHRCYGFFEELCDLILLQLRASTVDRKVKRAIRQILAIDSTECRVHGSLFSKLDWKQIKSTEHIARTKLHVIWNINGQWIDDFIVTGTRCNDSPVSHRFELMKNNTYVFDRAYSDLKLWLKITAIGSHFVSRMKGQVTAVLKDSQPSQLKEINHDGVLFDGIYRPKKCTLWRASVSVEQRAAVVFRYVVYRDPETKKLFYFVTSDFKSEPQVIAEIYKKRWAVELLFRWLKGHLNIRYLGSKSVNAIRIQLAAAVLTQLLLQLKKITEKFNGTLWELLRAIRVGIIRKGLSESGIPGGCRWKTATINNYTASFI